MSRLGPRLLESLCLRGAAVSLATAQPATPVSQDAVHEVAAQLRCVVCQNLSVADSPSEMASQMRAIIRERLTAGERPAEVRQYFVDRYGEWILLSPPRRGFNLLVWLVPLAAVGAGLVAVAVFLWRWACPPRGPPPPPGGGGPAVGGSNPGGGGRGTRWAGGARARGGESERGRASRSRRRGESVTGLLVVSIAVGVPALLFTLWPLLRRDARGRTFLPLPADPRQQLAEEKRAALVALRELDFEHAAGHVSDADFADLRARYEGEAAAILTALDQLGPADPAPPSAESRAPSGSAWRHPVALGTAPLCLVAFGIAVGVGIVRYTEPDPMAGQPPTGSRPLAALPTEAPPATGAGGRVPPPEVLRGMLQAARASLGQGRYGEAIAADQAVPKRDPDHLDPRTHLP